MLWIYMNLISGGTFANEAVEWQEGVSNLLFLAVETTPSKFDFAVDVCGGPVICYSRSYLLLLKKALRPLSVTAFTSKLSN